MRRTSIVVAAMAALMLSALGGVAVALHDTVDTQYGATLRTLNDSGANGNVDFAVDGTDLTVTIEASGLAPGLPHAQHLHGALDGSAPNVCPPSSADANGDGLISTPEGVPFYGGINVSLTTEGDTSPDSALALDRFPVADANGNLSYQRTIPVSQEIADNLYRLHLVQHGIDFDSSGAYDGEPSPLDPAAPFEATVPSTCGEVELTSVNGQSVNRLGGATRIDTAIEISEFQFPDGSEQVHLARRDVFADAVAGGSLMDGPILLVPRDGNLPDSVADEIARLSPTTVTVLGSPSAVSDEILIQAAQAAQR